MSDKWRHFDASGAPHMVDVGEKPVTRRWARASGRVRMTPETIEEIRQQRVGKGDVLQVARLAGIQAAKRTSEWIPLAHPLAIEAVSVDLQLVDPDTVMIEAEVRITAKTGVEMEALTAVSAAALAVYDMCKSLDRAITIEAIRLEEKGGGRSGMYVRPDGPTS
ncbi:MAG TPA: cyclic pyranopterin monophosphate synthase MoaC [Planctomycetaceae bacterium]|nr:cyclic pyranopterin monophosphate synthase MoaC [Planctomycetaceae bacterium]